MSRLAGWDPALKATREEGDFGLGQTAVWRVEVLHERGAGAPVHHQIQSCVFDARTRKYVILDVNGSRWYLQGRAFNTKLANRVSLEDVGRSPYLSMVRSLETDNIQGIGWLDLITAALTAFFLQAPAMFGCFEHSYDRNKNCCI